MKLSGNTIVITGRHELARKQVKERLTAMKQRLIADPIQL